MVPAAVVDASIDDLVPLLDKDDILIDGGNSHYVDDIRRAKALAAKGIHYVDVGTSGGVWGLERGYCMMIGGEPATVQHLDPLFETLAPGIGDIPRTPESGTGARHRRTGLSALRAKWRRALRQDGAQRHRVRPDGGLCRRPGHPARRQRRQAVADRRCRNDAAARARALSVRLQRRRDHGSMAARQCRRLLVAGPDGHRTARGSLARRSLPAASRIPARAAGRSWRRSTKRCPRRC